jgi:hypothetical protein
MKISDHIRQADLTDPQLKLYEKMSPAARRLFNDLAEHPDYRGQASTEQAILELSKTHLIELHHRGAKQPLVTLTRRGKQMAERLKASGRLDIKVGK